MSQLLSGKVRVVRPQDVSDDRYEYLSLQEAEPNLGIPLSGSIASGSVALIASDIDGNRLFITKIQLEEFSGSFSGSFAGDGSELNNLPFSSQLISGSASASIAPNTGFLVNVSSSFDGDVDVNGDVRVTGDLYVEDRIVAREILVQIVSSSIIFSSGSNKFGNTSDDLQEFTGSVGMNGSLNVEGGISTNSITASAVSSSAFIGDGSQLFNLPAAEQSSRIADGAVTASVDNENGFIVISKQSGSQFTGSLFVSGGVSLGSGSVFSGSGANLFDIPKAALTPDALLSTFIASGSVTASVDPDFGFRLEGTNRAEFSSSLFVSGGVNVGSGSTFSGSGENLFDIPRSALTKDALLSNVIVSGSVTASVSPNEGLIVTSIESGSTFFGDIKLQSGSFSGSGANLFNIPRSALTEDAELSTFITSGSITASVTPDAGFVVTSIESGSTFSGSVFLSSGSFFSGSGEKLFDIPKSAITDLDTSLIFSGSVTASTSPNVGFVVTSLENGSTFSGSVNISGSISASVFQGDGSELFNIPLSALTDTATLIASASVTASVSPDTGFRVVSQAVGSQFTGSVDVSTYIQAKTFVSASTFKGSGAELIDIVTTEIISGAVSANVTPDEGFVVTSVGSGSTFIGNVDVAGSVTTTDSIFVGRNVSSSMFSGSGAGLFDIPRSALTEDALLSTEIISGSVTASVRPDGGFVVTSLESGSTFIGSVTMDNSLSITDLIKISDTSITADSQAFFSGSGAGLFNIPRSALSEDALPLTEIATGSITASVTPEGGFIVTSIESGSTFSGSVFLSYPI